MPRYLLDTDICSYVIRRTHPQLLHRLRTTPIADVAISAITKAELLYGVEISPRRGADSAAVEGFLRHVQVLDFTGDAALDYAVIRASLRAAGQMIGANDLLIAAHARSQGLILVTNNMREFGRIERLALENWAA